MVISRVNYYAKHAGLTLIEVLIALAIIAIAMTAVIKASSQNIRGTAYLQEKTIALWVGQQALNEVRVGVTKPSGTEEIQQTIEMLGRIWYTQIRQEETPNKHIMKIAVKVFNREIEDEMDPLITLESYLYIQ